MCLITKVVTRRAGSLIILTKSPFLHTNFLLVFRALSMRIGFCVGRFSSSRNLLPRSHWSSPFSRSTWRLGDLSAKLCRKNTVAHFPISSPLSQGFPLLAQKYFVYFPKNISFSLWNNNDNHARDRPTAFPEEKSSCIGDHPRQNTHNAVVFSINVRFPENWPLNSCDHSGALSIPFLGPGLRKSIFPAKLSTFVHILKVNRLRLRMSSCREFLGLQGPLVQHRACLSAIKIWITNLKAYMSQIPQERDNGQNVSFFWSSSVTNRFDLFNLWDFVR